MRNPRLNIIYIVCHDLGKELGCYGKPILTPNIDAFARKGTLFANAYCSSPACSPSRNCAYTGLYAHNHGGMGLAHCGWSLDENVRTVVDYFNEAGYETVHAGLQHERHQASNRYQVEYNQGQGSPGRNLVENAVADAIDYLRGRGADNSRPFYLNIGTQEVHATCWQAQHNGLRPNVYGGTPDSEVYMPPYIPDTPELRKEMGNFQACIRYLDQEIQRLFAAVKELGYEHNTLVVFTTDHGISNERAKGTLYERGVEISLMASLPGVIRPEAICNELIPNIDIAPTLLDVAGIPAPDHMQGKSFWPLLADGNYKPHTEIYMERNYHGESHYDPMRAVRTDRYHYIRNFDPDAKRDWLPRDNPRMRDTYRNWFTNLWPDKTIARDAEELYDIAADPEELTNLAHSPDYIGVRTELAGKLLHWMKSTEDPLLQQKEDLP
jgi:arylsulfatase A-like enzyme